MCKMRQVNEVQIKHASSGWTFQKWESFQRLIINWKSISSTGETAWWYICCRFSLKSPGWTRFILTLTVRSALWSFQKVLIGHVTPKARQRLFSNFNFVLYRKALSLHGKFNFARPLRSLWSFQGNRLSLPRIYWFTYRCNN